VGVAIHIHALKSGDILQVTELEVTGS